MKSYSKSFWNCKNVTVSGSRNWKIGQALYLDPEITEMVQFFGPEIAEMEKHIGEQGEQSKWQSNELSDWLYKNY